MIARAILTLGALLTATGCTYAPTLRRPAHVAEHELVLTYEDGYVVSAEGHEIARAYEYKGLSEYVRCVPYARAHADQAERAGAAAVPLQIAGGVTAFAGLGGLSGIAYLGKNDGLAAGLLLGGFALQLVGLALVGGGAKAKVDANGHAIDAMNYYNDQVGSRGRSCSPGVDAAR